MNEKFCILVQMSLKYDLKGPIDNKAWRRTGGKLLPEPMLSQVTDAYMRN